MVLELHCNNLGKVKEAPIDLIVLMAKDGLPTR